MRTHGHLSTLTFGFLVASVSFACGSGDEMDGAPDTEAGLTSGSRPFTRAALAAPGTFEAENFDRGGEGVGYHDLTPTNLGGLYRTSEAVDVITSTDAAGGGYVVNNFQSGEWLAYTVRVGSTGTYDLELRAAQHYSAAPAFHVEVDGARVTSSIPVPNTGSWSTFQWVKASGIHLDAGLHVVRIVADAQYFDVNQIRITGSTSSSSPPVPPPVPPPAPPPAPTTPPPSMMVFWSGFEGATAVLTPTADDCYNAGCWQKIVGTDSTTGFTWPFSLGGGGISFQARPGTPASGSYPNVLGNYVVNQVVAGAGRSGSNALYSELKSRNDDSGQSAFIAQPGSDVKDLYVSFWAKFQPNLRQIMTNPNTWKAFFEWKTAGDYRISVNVTTYQDGHAGVPVWDLRGDNVANGSLPQQEYFRIVNPNVPVPVGEWFKFEIFWHRSAGSDGRVWAAVNGKVIGDRSGSIVGVNGAPINRIMMPNNYCGGAFPQYQWVDDMQIWSTFPTVAAGDRWYDPPYAAH